ncbi:hypothetical protein DFH06DRAFT_1364428 [Mycena polygramma]|nr:hypothetical protein DFH06DRAFT_1364428 [Mycena polygramma]
MDSGQATYELSPQKLVPLEKIVHKYLKAKGAWRGPRFCQYCGRHHIEKFDLDLCGGRQQLYSVIDVFVLILVFSKCFVYTFDEELESEQSRESVPEVYLPPAEDEESEDEEGGPDLSLTDALGSVSRTSSPQRDEATPKKNYDYSVSLRSEPKPSPFDKSRNVALRRPPARTRTPSLSRTTSSPASSPTLPDFGVSPIPPVTEAVGGADMASATAHATRADAGVAPAVPAFAQPRSLFIARAHGARCRVQTEFVGTAAAAFARRVGSSADSARWPSEHIKVLGGAPGLTKWAGWAGWAGLESGVRVRLKQGGLAALTLGVPPTQCLSVTSPRPGSSDLTQGTTGHCGGTLCLRGGSLGSYGLDFASGSTGHCGGRLWASAEAAICQVFCVSWGKMAGGGVTKPIQNLYHMCVQAVQIAERVSDSPRRRLPSKIDQYDAFLDQPTKKWYKDEDEGVLYFNVCAPLTAVSAFRSNNISRTDFMKKLKGKFGHTNNLKRRQAQYRRCDVGQIHLWGYRYDVQCRYLAERLTHLLIAHAGGARPLDNSCACDVTHREYVAMDTVGDVEDMHAFAMQALGDMGEVGVQPFRLTAPAGFQDVFDAIFPEQLSVL